MRAEHVRAAARRALDVTVALLVAVAALPVALLVAVVVALALGRPVLFRQVRAGQHGRPFTMLKFRSMLPVDRQRGVVTDEQRLTRFGRVLRSTSLDELPGLLNVLRGEMSMVGPRPLPLAYVGLWTPHQARRLEVRPGLTGLAQVSGRNALSWEDRLALDVEYVERRSLALDLVVLLRTVRVVVRREGVTQAGHATSSPFLGSPSPS
ncbi:sugar transferase [Frigoribacterium salinisoli]